MPTSRIGKRTVFSGLRFSVDQREVVGRQFSLRCFAQYTDVTKASTFPGSTDKRRVSGRNDADAPEQPRLRPLSVESDPRSRPVRGIPLSPVV
jgi:hypothetical protein